MPLTEEQKKERRKEASRKYREANREYYREYYKEYNKKWREANIEKKKEYKKKYRKENKDKIREYNKKYHLANIEKERLRGKKYYEENTEKIKLKSKNYRKENPEKVHKSYTISQWKKQGVKHDDYKSLYNKCMNTEYCECCGCKLTTDKVMTLTTRCLDHCHITGLFRRVLCNGCNLKLPRQTKKIINNININNVISKGSDENS